MIYRNEMNYIINRPGVSLIDQLGLYRWSMFLCCYLKMNLDNHASNKLHVAHEDSG